MEGLEASFLDGEWTPFTTTSREDESSATTAKEAKSNATTLREDNFIATNSKEDKTSDNPPAKRKKKARERECSQKIVNFMTLQP